MENIIEKMKIHGNLVCFILLFIFNSVSPQGNNLGKTTTVDKQIGFIDINMPNVRPIKNDDYICTANNIANLGTQYIHAFEPSSNADRAHHMLLFVCDKVPVELMQNGSWDCAHHYAACNNMKIIYAWAKNAPPTILPKDVGFRIGPESNNNYLVLQVHYAHPMPEGTKDQSGFRLRTNNVEPKFLAGIFLLARGYLPIPANTEKTHGDVNCILQSPSPIYPFAYRVHTHKLGSVVSGYVLQSGAKDFQFLAKGNPQWPQAFYPMKQKMAIRPNDLVTARCTYNTVGYNKTTEIGMTAGDEMCNLYVMFYTASRDPEDHYLVCSNEQFPQMTEFLPEDSDVPLPRNKTLEEHAMGPGLHHQHSGGLNVDADGGETSEKEKLKKNHAKKRPGIEYTPSQFHHTDYPEQEDSTPNEDTNRLAKKLTTKSLYHVTNSWPDSSVKLGQASGVDFDTRGNVVVFHRGDRTWGYDTFDTQNRYNRHDLGPIGSNTVFVIDPSSGKILHEWGKDMFYMPHDITVAPNGDTFLTDVALHQVFKFKPGTSSPQLTLGEAFVPGNDDNHFCKPSAVAVMSSGDFFVADGYCNSRIIKFDSKGKKLLMWGRSFQPSAFDRLFGNSIPPYAFAIPHALALAEDQDMIMVADRENGRIQCFSASEGKFHYSIESPAFGGKLFSVSYSPIEGGTLFAVNGPSSWLSPTKVQGFVIPLTSRTITSVFSPNGLGFGQPHDIVVSRNGSQIYVVEISLPYKIWKFERNANNFSMHRTGKGSQDADSGSVAQPLLSASTPNKDSHEHTVVVPVGNPSLPKLPDETQSKVLTNKIGDDSFNSSVIIMAFLTIPLLLLIGIGALLRLRSTHCCCKRKESKSFSEFFPPSAGFEKLRMDESESENSDAEVEEYAVPAYRKPLNA